MRVRSLPPSIGIVLLTAAAAGQQAREVGRAELPPRIFDALRRHVPPAPDTSRAVAYGDVPRTGCT